MSVHQESKRVRRASLTTTAGPFGLLVDPVLPRLAAALDPAAMARRFAKGFAERARGPAPRVGACEVEEVYHRSGRHCGILYRLRLEGAHGAEHDEWLYARMLPGELVRERYAKALDGVVAAGASALVSTALDPVSLWEDLDVIVWAFPNDPKLPGLRAMADAARVRGQLERQRGGTGRAADGNGDGPGDGDESLVIERVKYMPTKRCVLRYRLAPEPGSEGPRPPAVYYAKAYPVGASAAPFQLQRAVRERLSESGAAVEIAEPLVHIPEESVIWFADWGGFGIIGEAAERGWDAMADRAATALAAFHRVSMSGLPEHRPPADELVEAREDAAKYAARVGEAARPVLDMLTRLERELPRTGDRPAVSLHGAFRAEHVHVRGTDAALLDLDGMASGDPLVDVAEFVASLEFLALRSTAGPIDSEAVSQRFLEAYAAAVPWTIDGASLGWYARTSLLRKLHGAVKRLARPTLDRLEAHGADLVERWNGIAAWAPRPRTRWVGARARAVGAGS